MEGGEHDGELGGPKRKRLNEIVEGNYRERGQMGEGTIRDACERSVLACERYFSWKLLHRLMVLGYTGSLFGCNIVQDRAQVMQHLNT